MKSSPAPSLAGRAVLAVVLLVGFYVFALGIAAALLYVPYAEAHYLNHVTGRLALFCIVGAGVIVWSILPRPDRFTPPGPRLAPSDHPRLFELLRSVAGRAGQEMPAEVYAIPEMNAWVAQRGGVMGVGSRRVMGIGLPLLQALTVRQTEAVIAHEFGHFHGGDTALGPWIYKTRAAIGRTLEGLARHTPLLTRPFIWYMKGFLRITHAISRRQEFVADALAARIAGSAAMIEGLKVVHGAARAFEPYWYSEYAPALERGYQPPLAEGFARFLRSPRVAGQVRESVEAELAAGTADPYDTHPPLRDRVAALSGLPSEAAPEAGADAPAVTLLGDVAGVERELISRVVRGAKGAPARLEAMGWEEMTEQVWVPAWRELAGSAREALRGFTPAALADHAADPDAVVVRLGLAADREVVTDQHREQARGVVGCALAVALHDAGMPVYADPGDEVTVEVRGVRVRPFSLPGDLASGRLAPDDWRELAREAGVADLDLGSLPAPAAGAA